MSSTDVAQRTEMELKMEQKILCDEIEGLDNIRFRGEKCMVELSHRVLDMTEVNENLLEENSKLADENRKLRMEKDHWQKSWEKCKSEQLDEHCHHEATQAASKAVMDFMDKENVNLKKQVQAARAAVRNAEQALAPIRI